MEYPNYYPSVILIKTILLLAIWLKRFLKRVNGPQVKLTERLVLISHKGMTINRFFCLGNFSPYKKAEPPLEAVARVKVLKVQKSSIFLLRYVLMLINQLRLNIARNGLIFGVFDFEFRTSLRKGAQC